MYIWVKQNYYILLHTLTLKQGEITLYPVTCFIWSIIINSLLVHFTCLPDTASDSFWLAECNERRIVWMANWSWNLSQFIDISYQYKVSGTYCNSYWLILFLITIIQWNYCAVVSKRVHLGGKYDLFTYGIVPRPPLLWIEKEVTQLSNEKRSSVRSFFLGFTMGALKELFKSKNFIDTLSTSDFPDQVDESNLFYVIFQECVRMLSLFLCFDRFNGTC